MPVKIGKGGEKGVQERGFKWEKLRGKRGRNKLNPTKIGISSPFKLRQLDHFSR